jgi:flagellar biosynthesis/type III secretory pathway protein FliH
LSNIIRQDHAKGHNIQPFTILEASVNLAASAPGRVIPESVLTGVNAYAGPVRFFHFYEHPLQVDTSPRRGMKSEPDTLGSAILVVDPENTDPPSEPAGLDEAAVLPEDAAHAAAARLARERERVLQEAQDEATRYLTSAREQAVAITAAAHEQGFKEGEAAARQALMAQLTPVLGAFQQAIAEIGHLRALVLRQAEEDIIALAFQLARKIIRYEVREHREALATTLKCALEQVVEQDQIVVRVHPEDLQYATEITEERGHVRGDLKTLTVQGDTSIGRGGCVVETSLGTIDARIEAQFDELEQRFRDQRSLDLEASVA